MTAADPYAIRLWLALKLSDGRSDALYIRTIRTAHTPTIDDEIHLWHEHDPQPGSGPWPIRRRYWDADGLLNINMAYLIHNPDDTRLQWIRTSDRRQWIWQDQPGDTPHYELLRAAGWTEYRGEP